MARPSKSFSIRRRILALALLLLLAAAVVLIVFIRDYAQRASNQAFDRLLGLAAEVTPEERDRIRVRLLELFEIAGRTDQVVLKARRRLATVLF